VRAARPPPSWLVPVGGAHASSRFTVSRPAIVASQGQVVRGEADRDHDRHNEQDADEDREEEEERESLVILRGKQPPSAWQHDARASAGDAAHDVGLESRRRPPKDRRKRVGGRPRRRGLGDRARASTPTTRARDGRGAPGAPRIARASTSAAARRADRSARQGRRERRSERRCARRS
jgi:hypothetical protein